MLLAVSWVVALTLMLLARGRDALAWLRRRRRSRARAQHRSVIEALQARQRELQREPLSQYRMGFSEAVEIAVLTVAEHDRRSR